MAVSFDLVLSFALVLLAIFLFATEIVSPDLTALIIMGILLLAGIVTPEEGVSGFSNPATMTVLAMFILSAGIYRTGMIHTLASHLARWGGRSEVWVLLLIALIVGPVSAFVNNTAAVAVLLPLVLSVAKETSQSPSKLLIPLSYIAMLAGVITLVGTSTNLLASDLASKAGLGGFDIFMFAPVGLAVFAIGTLYLLLVGRHLIPARIPAGETSTRFNLRRYRSEIRVQPGGPLAGKTLDQVLNRELIGVEVVSITRGGDRVPSPASDFILQENDVLTVLSPREVITALTAAARVHLAPRPEDPYAPRRPGEGERIVEVVVAPTSIMTRRRYTPTDIEAVYDVRILGVSAHVNRIPIPPAFGLRRPEELDVGDTLLVRGAPRDLDQMREDPAFLFAEEAEISPHRRGHSVVALAIFASVVTVAAMGIYPILVTSWAGAILMVLTGVLRPNELYRSIRWDVIFLLAGIIPLGIALEKSGGAHLIANAVAGAAGYVPPIALVFMFYAASMILTELISNNACVLLLGPIAITTAGVLDVNPITLLLAVMFAASTAFMTPIGYQTNLLIYGPGGYRFSDFFRVGAPLNLLLLLVTPVLLVYFFPL